MSSKVLNRVVFFSKEDGASFSMLRKAEELLRDVVVDDLHELNDLLEFHSIKLYFENGMFLPEWDDTVKKNYADKVEQALLRAKDLFIKMNDETFPGYIAELEFSYRSSFWKLFNYYKTYKRINKDVFLKALRDHPHQINYVLNHYGAVDHFDTTLREFLMSYETAAELLLSKIEERERFREVNYIFPKSLTLPDREDIISRYLDQDDPNLNYVRLIEYSIDSSELKLSRNVRLKAKKRSKELNDEILSQGNAHETGIEITFNKNQEEPVTIELDGMVQKFSYSESYLDQKTSDIGLFMVFKELFRYIDSNGLITLTSKRSELILSERIGMESKNEYPAGINFQRKQNTAYVQLRSFDHYLRRKNRTIEELILSFIDLALNKYFRLESLLLRLPSANSSYLEKIRALAPEFEAILKQYLVYIEEGKIDFELIQVDQIPLSFSSVKSPLEKKYAYVKNDKIKMLIHHFYSDQGMLHYVPPFDEQYSNGFDLLLNEELKLDQFLNYQQDLIKHLIAEDYLFADANGHIKMKNVPLFFLIGELHRDEVLSYWHYDQESRETMDEMERSGMIEFDNNLLSKQEISYFNFNLNMKGFTNGLNIRNKYLHGSNSGSTARHEYEYYVLLEMIILAILKITDDLSLQLSVAKTSLKKS